MSVIAVIPARSGSQRIKNKNITKLSNKPLIYWTIKTAINSKIFDKILFSSDSRKYWSILNNSLKKSKLKTKNLLFDLRNKKFVKNNSKIFDYLKSKDFKSSNLKKNDLIVLLLPTFPLRTINTVKKAVRISLKTGKDIFTAHEYDFHLSFAFSLKNQKWKNLFNFSPMITGKTRSQNQKKFYRPNGVASCVWVKNLSKKKTLYTDSLAIISDNLESIDIDTKQDLIKAEMLFKLKK